MPGTGVRHRPGLEFTRGCLFVPKSYTEIRFAEVTESEARECP